MLERLKKETNYASDIIYKEITIQGQKITLVYSEVLTSGSDISAVVLKNIAKIIDEDIPLPKDLFLFFYNLFQFFLFLLY